ncbi:acyltransferase family protein (plasmid) [Klebsiella quasipneumoniae]|uniref:acyltransferase family protein n=2 Tax=Klebsiella pneumoniae complex TaxID=3390273 RepID=UPI0033908C28
MFRLDINGLRFIAVLSVVFFHFQIPFFSGGYAGVDIFFVISGYLMHSILSKDKMSVANTLKFYKKRLTRIYPALVACFSLFSIIYIFIMPPSLIKMLLWQLTSALTFTSNLYFTKELSSYFSGTAESYLFLHSWSLSLEFQYYIAFPFILFLVRKSKLRECNGILILAILSFLICLTIVNINQKVAFFNLPFRAWELLLGAYASSIDFNIKFKNKRIIEVLCIGGLLSFMFFSGDSSKWPDIKAIVPTLLTFILLVIHVENDKTLLKNKLFQIIGSSSYSIYLYHWPIVSIAASYGLIGNFKATVLLLIISIALGFISYCAIEKRDYSTKRNKRLVLFLIVVSITTPLTVINFNLSRLWLSEKKIALDSYSNYDSTEQFSSLNTLKGKTCFLSSGQPSIDYYDYIGCTQTDQNKKTILLFGDSHAAEFSKALKEKYSNYNIIQATASGCPPLKETNGASYCVELSKMVFNKIIKEKKIDIAFLGADWNGFEKNNDLAVELVKTNKILKETIPEVHFISQTKKYKTDLYKLIIAKGDGYAIHPNDDALLTHKKMKDFMTGVSIVDIYDYDCKYLACNVIDKNNVPMYFDNNHYTFEWTKKIVSDMF